MPFQKDRKDLGKMNGDATVNKADPRYRELFDGIDAYISQHYVEGEEVNDFSELICPPFSLGSGVNASKVAGRKRIRLNIPDFRGNVREDRLGAAQSFSEAPLVKRSLDDCIRNLDKTFMEMVFTFADERGMTDVEVQRRSNLDKKTFSKLKCGNSKNPSKSTALALAIGLKLNIDDTKDLLSRAGFALSPCSKRDLIVQYFIEADVYDIDAINEALFEHDEPLLGSAAKE